jgi:hypothetical protein
MARRPERLQTKLPMNLGELVEAGGPEALARRVAEQAADEAARHVRRFWPGILEGVELNVERRGLFMCEIADTYKRDCAEAPDRAAAGVGARTNAGARPAVS